MSTIDEEINECRKMISGMAKTRNFWYTLKSNQRLAMRFLALNLKCNAITRNPPLDHNPPSYPPSLSQLLPAHTYPRRPSAPS